MQSIASASAQPAAHDGDHLVHGRVRLDDHQAGDLDAAELAHAAEVVAHEVGDHQVLGAGLVVAAQLGGREGVGDRLAAGERRCPSSGATPRCGSRSTRRKRSGEELSTDTLAQPQERRERRGVAGAQRAIGGQRVQRAVAAQLGRQADLIGLPLEDLALGGLDVRQVGGGVVVGARSAAAPRAGGSGGSGVGSRARARQPPPVSSSQPSSASVTRWTRAPGGRRPAAGRRTRAQRRAAASGAPARRRIPP